MHAGTAAGTVSLKKPHDIVTLQFSEVVKSHAIYVYGPKVYMYFFLVPCWLLFETRRPREKKFGGLGNMMRYKLLWSLVSKIK